MRAFYCDEFVLPLPSGHRFPMAKYALLRRRVEASGSVRLAVPDAASDELLGLAHTPAYVAALRDGTLAPAEVRRLGFPWSPELVERGRRSVGATLAAARAALEEGVAANLAGGTHHAFADRGEGYCCFNDVAVAARALQREGRVARVLVVDTDVHQGNGTAAIFRGDDTVFTFSIHGARNFPFHKEESDLDVELPDGTADEGYLAALARGLEIAFACAPDLVFWVSGADPFAGDRLGRLALSKAGLGERDRRVLEACRSAGVPVVLTMAGGYAHDVADTVDIHYESVLQALGLHRRWRGESRAAG